jgi:hypothetical protein
MTIEQVLRTPGSIAAPAVRGVREERVEVELVEPKKESFWVYKAFAGHPGSSSDNLVLTDLVISKLADLFHLSDADLMAEKDSQPEKICQTRPRW